MNVKLFVVLAGSLAISTSVHAATFTVINTNVTGAGSLQQAIFDANTNAGADTISFNIASGGLTISPTNALPIIVEPVTIDGRTQPGFVSAPIIEVNGAGAGAAVDGLKIATSNCIVSALVINRFLGDQIEITNGVNNTVEGCYLGLNLAGTVDASTGLNGILITNAANNIIGGLGATNRNFISGNNQSGVAIGGASSVSNSILGNVIGLNVTNNAVANSADGFRVNAPFTLIGGSAPGARNIISGNTGDGIETVATLATNCVIRGNWIGVDTNGVLDRGNTVNGILASAGAAIIGGSGAGEGNVISGNNDDGIELNGVSSTNHLVLGNVIGSSSAFAASVINSGNGILITTSSRSNVIGGILAGAANTIYFNGGDGIGVAAANANTNNAFRGNLIFGNAASGIDLGAAGITANDNGDPDVGANQLQNFPVLTSVSNTATDVFITGTLNSRSSTTYAIDFYSSVEADTVLNGEGQFYIGSTNLATAANSNLTFTVSFSVVLQGRHVTATATDPFSNTSEFSAAAASVSFALAQTFTVVNTNDSGGGSLREAINQANLAATTGGDTIVFAITNLSTTISPSSELPSITDPVTVDGYTQSGAAVNTSATAFNGTVLVRLAGASAGSGANGLTITVGNSTVRGLMITGFTGTGDGIEISGGGNNVIEGCLIGIDAAGTDQGNAANGISISSSPNNIIGGNSPAARNVISGNQSDGVEITGATAIGNQIYGNLIGTGLGGATDVGNSADGILVSGSGATIIGGTISAAGNLISGNGSDGIELTGLSTTGTMVLGNRMGTEVTGTATLANGANGVNISGNSRNNSVGGVLAGEGNTIAFNGADGITVAAAVSNTNNVFRGNSIFSNGTTTGELGIDLGTSGVTSNDAGDTDGGANQLQNYPVLVWVTNSATETTFSGSLNSTPSTTFTIDFYANTAPDTGGAGEGRYYLASTNISTAADSNVIFTVSLPVASLPARYITATATDPFGNTSEFATNVFAQSIAPAVIYTVVNTNDSGAGSLRQAILDANVNVSSGDIIAFAITNVSKTILPASVLPVITDAVTIDGSTQPGFSGAPIVELDGISAGASVDGLGFAASNCVVRALAINRFRGDGIAITGGRANMIEGCYLGLGLDGLTRRGNGIAGINIVSSPQNVIGGLDATNRNFISGNTNSGIIISGTGVNAGFNQIVGNIIGLNTTNGIVLNSGGGMFSSSPFTIVGGSATGSRNIISGNTAWGISLLHPATNCVIQGNYIGTDPTGTIDLGSSGYGVTSTAGGTVVGGAGANEGNLISGNFQAAVEFNGTSSTNNVVKGNILGADITGTLPIPNNHGVSITGNSRSNVVGGVLAGEANLIAFNVNDGITVAAAVSNTNNAFRKNIIHSNGVSSLMLGIDLGADGILANDAGDVDTGANQLQNFPVLTGVTNSFAGTDVAGTMNSAANTTYELDFYANVASTLSGNGAGQFYLGSASVTTDGTGTTNFFVTLATTNLGGRYVTATATDPFGNTSEFGTNIFAFSTVPGLTLVVTNTNDIGPGSLREAILIANTNINTGDTITFNIAGAGVQTISPLSPLPSVLDPVTINGYTQPGASANTLTNGHDAVILIRLDGASAGSGAEGLKLSVLNNQVRGLAITRFNGNGIEITLGNGNLVQGCYIGIAPDGITASGNNNSGIFVNTTVSQTLIGGGAVADRCIISGNNYGVFIGGVFNAVQGCSIGTDDTGTVAVGNTNSGVWISGTAAKFNTIGGTNATERNVISGNGLNFTSIGDGIRLSQCVSNSILGNYIGTTASGSAALGNQDDGISLESGASTNFIGGSVAGAGNVISANSIGIDFSSSSPDQVRNVVQGNLIGTDASGFVALGNLSHGISFSFADFNQIGGKAAGERNVISGNSGNGVNVNCCAAASNVFEGNFVGVAVNGISALGNGTGGFFNGSPGTRIGGTAPGAGNIIANNNGDGIIHFISSSLGVSILGNNIYSNDGMGIELGLDSAPTPNDAGDTDIGPNNFQNFPVFTRAAIYPTETVIEGTLNSISNRDYRVEFFSNVAADPTGFGEGQVYLGFTNVTTDATGNGSFVFVHPSALVSNHCVSATATDTNNNTSEFSSCFAAMPFDTLNLVVNIQESANLVTTTTNFTYTLFVTNNGPTNATSVLVSNVLPATVNLVSAAPSLGSITNYGGVVVWEISSLPYSQSASAVLTVIATTSGVVSNYASVSSLEPENLPSNNSDIEATTVGVADVGVTRIATPNPVVAGMILTNIVTVTNRGPDTATSVVLNYFVDGTMIPLSGVTSQGSISLSGNTYTALIGSITAGNIATVTILAVPTESGEKTDFGSISRFENDPTSANNSFVASVTVIDGSGVFQFQQADFNVAETGGSVVIAVQRTGGTLGTTTVDFSAVSGTAMAGGDFVSTNGTLTFTNGESVHYFTVAISDDVAAECNETFSLALGNATGGGVAIGNTNLVITIFDNELTDSGDIALSSVATTNPPPSTGAGDSQRPSISYDGRYVAFQSRVESLLTNVFDNQSDDIFLFDFVTRQISLVSVSTSGNSADGYSYEPLISRTGRHVMFYSSATDLISGDTNGYSDVFVRNLDSGVTTLASKSTTGEQGDYYTEYTQPEGSLISSNGNIIVFESIATTLATNDSNGSIRDVFAHDLTAGTTMLVSADTTGAGSGDLDSFGSSVSGDGRYVVFASDSTNLSTVLDGNSSTDIFRRDLWSNSTELVSITLGNTASGDSGSYGPQVSHDGRYVAFHSAASDVSTNGGNSYNQVYRRDMLTGETLLISSATNGVESDNHSSLMKMTPDGRFILFQSLASDLVTNDVNNAENIFVRDVVSGATVGVNYDLNGDLSNVYGLARSISDDGRYVVFHSDDDGLALNDNNGTQDVFVRDLLTSTTTLLSREYTGVNSGINFSTEAMLSGNGSNVAFTASANTDDIAPRDANSSTDVFVRSLAASSNVLASASVAVSANGYSFAPVISADGTHLVFASYANNLTQEFEPFTEANIFVRNLASNTVTLVSVGTNGGMADNYCELPAISVDNRFVLFYSTALNLVANPASIVNNSWYLRDLVAGTTMPVAVDSTGSGAVNGTVYDGKMTPDARFIVFESDASNLTTNAGIGIFNHIFIRNRTNATAELVTLNAANTGSANSGSFDPVLSDDGRYVAFESDATDFGPTDNNNQGDVYVRDRLGVSNILVSVNSAATGPGNGGSYDPLISANGRYVVFYSDASNLVSGDTNNQSDIFIRDLQLNTTMLVSVKSSGAGTATGGAYNHSMTPDARYVIFESDADDLVPNDANGSTDVFVRDTVAGTTTLISLNCDAISTGNGHSYFWDYDLQHISSDGRYVTFHSDATDLAPGDYQSQDNVFRRDLLTGTTTLVSQNRFVTGSGNSGSWEATISTNGNVIGFASSASDLLDLDLNQTDDVFTWTPAVVVPAPDLVMDKTASVASVLSGNNYTYTLAVTNIGSAGASSVSVTDALPVATSFVSATTSQGTVTNSAGTVIATVGSLGVGTGASITITVTATTAGNVTNTASASSSVIDATPANNTDSVVVTITSLTLPTLSIQPTNSTQLFVSWPASTSSGFVLETATNLVPVIVWSPVTNSVSISGTNKFVILDVIATEPERYYRLKQ